eukprot:2030423-Rhodomonas_salina.2
MQGSRREKGSPWNQKIQCAVGSVLPHSHTPTLRPFLSVSTESLLGVCSVRRGARECVQMFADRILDIPRRSHDTDIRFISAASDQSLFNAALSNLLATNSTVKSDPAAPTATGIEALSERSTTSRVRLDDQKQLFRNTSANTRANKHARIKSPEATALMAKSTMKITYGIMEGAGKSSARMGGACAVTTMAAVLFPNL